MASRFAGIKTNAREGTMELNKTAKGLREIAGIDIYSDKSKGEVKDMMEILQELNGVWDTLNQDKKFAIGEAVAGLEHANTFQALMGNWEDVLKFQEDYKNGFTIGSAEKENERYLDSIEGKLNVLKENMKSLLTTTISSDMFKSAIDGLITFTDGLNKTLQALDKIGGVTPVVFGAIAGLFSGMKGFNSLSILTTGWTRDMSLMQKATMSTRDGMSMLGMATAKAGGFLKNFLTQGLLIAGITIAVKLLAKGWDYLTNSVKNTAKELQEVEDGQLSTIKSYKEKQTTLETIGKEYEKLSNKAKKTAEEEQRMLELGNELARVMPELQIGTDDNGNAIISMTTDMEGYIGKTKEAIEQQNRLLMGTRLDQADNALTMLTKGEKIGSQGLNDQKVNLQKEYYSKMKDLEEDYQIKMTKARNKDGEAQKKALAEARKVKEDMVRLELEYGNKYSEVQSQVMEQAGHYRDAMNSIWQDSASLLIEDLSPQMEKNIQQFVGALDFSEISSQEELDSVKSMFRELPKLAQDGTVDMEKLNQQLKDINSEFARTGNLEDYNLNMEKLADSLSEQTGWDSGVLKEMFTVITDGSLQSASSLDNFLQAFGKTTQELRNGDNVAKEIQKQFVGIQDAIESINNNDFSSEIATYNLRVKLQTDENLPQQVKDMVGNLSNIGVDDTTVVTLTAEVLMAFKDGKIDTQELEILKEQADSAIEKSLEADGKEYTQEMQLAVHGYLESVNSEEILNGIDEKLGEGEVEKSVTVTVDGEGVQKVKDVEEALSILEKRPEVLNEVRTVIDGDEDLVLYAEIIRNLPVGKEYTNKFIVENKEAISNMKSYQEVADYINSLPDDVKKTYGFNVEGGQETLETVENINKEVEKDKVVEIKTNNGEVLDSIKDIETLIDLSAKVEDGKYKLDFETNTQDAVTQLQNLKDEVNNLANQLRQVPSTDINIGTERSAKNLSGLNVRIEETKTALSSLSSKNVNVNTAQSAKNLSGLKVRVQEYTTAINGVLSRNVNVNTAQSAKNLSGLIRKIGEYNNTKVKNINITTNASSVARQINSISSALRLLPSTKTVRVNVQQSGSVSRIQRSLSGLSEGTYSSPVQPLTDFGTQVVANTLSMQQGAREGVMPIDTPPSVSVGGITPFNYSRPLDVIKYGYDYFIELENKLKKITNQLELIDEKSKDAFGQEKINYLKQQIELYKQQQVVQQQLVNDMKSYQSSLKSFLSGKGFKFDSSNNVTNYHTKLIAMEKELERLEGIANKDKATDRQKQAYENYKKNLDEIKKAMSEYLDVTFNGLPDAVTEWEKLQNSIDEANLEILKATDELQNLKFDIKVDKIDVEMKKIQQTIKKLDREIESAFGSKKEELIKKKIVALRQEQAQVEKLKSAYREQAKFSQNYLKTQGFKMNSDGSIANMEHLEKLANSSNFEYIKETLEEYIDLTSNKIPELEDDWWSLQDSINESNDAIAQAKKELEEFLKEAKVEELTGKFNDLEHQLSMVDKALKHATGKDKLDLMKEKVELLKKQQIELQKQMEYFGSEKNGLQKFLEGQGFEFDANGGITNYLSRLEELSKSSANFEEIKEKLEEYLELQEKIPGLEEDWADLSNAMKDAMKEQLEMTKDIEGKITEVYKKQVQERIKQMEKETDEKIKALKKQQDEYNKYREEANYKDDYNDKLTEVEDIQRQLDIAMRDSSINGQKKVKELQEMLANAQKELEKLVQDKIDKDVNDAFDSESDRLQEENDKAIEDLENTWSDSKIAEMVAQALGSGVFTDIEGNVSSLEDALVDFAEETGELFGVLGETIKTELITNLGIAMETVKNLGDYMEKIDLSKMMTSQSIPNSQSMGGLQSRLSNVSLNSPLIVVEGNVDSSVLEDLKVLGTQIKNDVINSIATAIR